MVICCTGLVLFCIFSASPTFTGTVTAPSFAGNLTGNATTATSATTATTATTAATATSANAVAANAITPSDLNTAVGPTPGQVPAKGATDTFTWVPPERHREADFLAAAREEEVYIALDGERIIGLAALYRPQTFLHSLYVAERGRGIGKALLDHVVAACDGRLQLKCQAANKLAQAFYVREGFRCTEAGEDGGVAWLRFVRDTGGAAANNVAET